MAMGAAFQACADAVACLRFFSRLPLPPDAETRPFGQAIRMLPLASLVIGACGALPLGLAVAAGLPPSMAAILGVAGGLLATGGLHEDGLADTADGFGGGASRHRKLAIMRDSRIGTFGVLALATVLAWRVAALTTLLVRTSLAETLALMLCAAAVSRALALLPLAVLPPAREDGLGHGVGPLDRGSIATCFGLAATIGVALPPLAGAGLGHALLACLTALFAGALLTRLARSQIGGHTGDVAGACQQVAEAGYFFGLLAFPLPG